MANQLSNLQSLDLTQFNALNLKPIPGVRPSSTGNVHGVNATINGATADGRNIGITVNYPAGYKYTTALSGDSRAIDIDLNVNISEPITTKYFEVSIDNINVFTSAWTVDIDVQMGSGNPTTQGTWQFVKSVVVEDELKKEHKK